MKTLYLMLLFVLVFALGYFTLSLFGLLFGETYHSILGNTGWFIGYSLFLGWVPPTLVVMEEHERIFKD